MDFIGIQDSLKSGTTISGDRPALSDSLGANLAKSHLPSLDGLRAIAAFLVVFFHGGIPWVPGGLGVLAFFVLSGFLITWLLLKEKRSSPAQFRSKRSISGGACEFFPLSTPTGCYSVPCCC